MHADILQEEAPRHQTISVESQGLVNQQRSPTTSFQRRESAPTLPFRKCVHRRLIDEFGFDQLGRYHLRVSSRHAVRRVLQRSAGATKALHRIGRSCLRVSLLQSCAKAFQRQTYLHATPSQTDATLAQHVPTPG